jgi:cysteine-rich repeat protein
LNNPRGLCCCTLLLFVLGAGCGGDSPGANDNSINNNNGVSYRCGNGTIEPGEGCDDGNNVDEDGCSAECGLEPCDLPSSCNVICLWKVPQPTSWLLGFPMPRLGSTDVLVKAGGSVYRISDTGEVTTVFAAQPDHVPILDTNGDRFGVWQGDGSTLFLYGGDGELRSSFPTLYSAVELVPSTERVMGYLWGHTPEDEWLVGLDVLDANGEVVYSFGEEVISDYDTSRLSGDGQALLVQDSSALSHIRMTGEVLWNIPGRFHNFEVSQDGQRLIGKYSTGESCHLFDYGVHQGTLSYPSEVGVLAMSPSGEFAGFNTQDQSVHLTANGTDLFSTPFPVDFPMVEVSDTGDILVSGQVESLQGQVWLLDVHGNQLWDAQTGLDNDGFQPESRFLSDADHFWVRTRQFLALFQIVDRDPSCL